MRSRSLPLLVVAMLASACMPGDVDDAGEVDPDAGSAGDAGAIVDASVPDAGVPDAGVPDAGALAGEQDAGPPPPDADAGPDANAYWSTIDGALTGAALVSALHEKLASTHTELDYDALFDAYATTDTPRGACAGGELFDFYSSHCWDPNDRCGNYDGEGQCFNREHSWPKSWWGGSESVAPFTDLFHVIPADGYVNNLRGNLPLGDVGGATYTSTNGSSVGACASPGVTGNCFEPAASLKGDLARIYFYVAVRYEGELGCCDNQAVDGADVDAWLEVELRAWHAADPVDDVERARNEAVFAVQGNRNPFVDRPSWVGRIGDY